MKIQKYLIFATLFLCFSLESRSDSNTDLADALEIEEIHKSLTVLHDIQADTNLSAVHRSADFQSYQTRHNDRWSVKLGISDPVYVTEYHSRWTSYRSDGPRIAEEIETLSKKRDDILKRLKTSDPLTAIRLEIQALDIQWQSKQSIIDNQATRYNLALRAFRQRQAQAKSSFWRAPVYEVQFRDYDHYDHNGVEVLKKEMENIKQNKAALIQKLRLGHDRLICLGFYQ